MSNKTLTIGLVVAIVLAIGAYFFPQIQQKTGLFGSTDCQQTTCLTGGLRILTGTLESDGAFQIGSAGALLTLVDADNDCSLVGNVTLAASSTASLDCSVSSVLSGDITFAQFATSTAPVAGIQILGASASSTAGFLTLRVYNGTGASYLIPASVASSTQYQIYR